MIFKRTTALGLAAGSVLGLVALASSASAQDAIVPGAFVVAEVAQQEPQPVLAPLPPQRSAALTPRASRTAAAPVRIRAPVERVAYVDQPRRRVEASLWSFSTRPGFMFIGTVY